MSIKDKPEKKEKAIDNITYKTDKETQRLQNLSIKREKEDEDILGGM